MSGIEQRRTVRVPLLIPVRVETSQGTFNTQGRDISLGGIGVYLKKRFPRVGSLIDVSLTLPRSKDKVEATGTVMYVKHGGPADNWMGVEFSRMSAESREAIERYVKETHGSDHITGPAPPPLPKKQ